MYSMHVTQLILIFQHVNAFVYAMALDENDATKHDKLIALKLATNEWERVELFLGLLTVCFSFLSSLSIIPLIETFSSMLTMPSKRFRQIRCQRFTLAYLPLRRFTKHGHHEQKGPNMRCSLSHLRRHVRKQISIMRRQRTHQRTSWLCVCCQFFPSCLC